MKKLISKFALVLAIAFVLQLVNFTPLFMSKSYASGNLKLEMTNSTLSPSPQLLFALRITNLDSTSINLANIKLRYYFTSDGCQQQSIYFWDAMRISANGPIIDHITTKVSGSFVQMTYPVNNADTYAEIGFANDAGYLALNESAEIYISITAGVGNYNQTNDYSFNSSTEDIVEWNRVPVYNSGTLVSGSAPKGFLIIAAKPLYDAGLTQLATYQNDILGDGYSSTVITVDNTTNTNPQYVCTTASQLKNVIRNYYNAGFVGFVLIGSYPHIPTAYWRPVATDRPVRISDYYFADLEGEVDSDFDGQTESVTDWIDTDSDGVYEVSGYYNNGLIPLITKPEMFYGRIDAATTFSEDYEEKQLVDNYLLKLHNFRVGRSSIPTSSMKAFGFVHQDWSGEYGDIKTPTKEYDLLKTVFPHMNIMEDKETVSIQNLIDELSTNEYYFSHIVAHGSPQWIYLSGWSNNHPSEESSYIPTMSDFPNSYLVHSFGYDALKYVTPDVDNDYHVTGASFTANMGFTFLFCNETTVNVTGACAPADSDLDQQYFTGLSTMSIGESYKGWLNRIYDDIGWSDVASYVLLGDPTLRHPLQYLTNRAPVLTNNLGTLEATTGYSEVLPLAISNPEAGESVSVTVPVMPEWADFDSSTNVISWTTGQSQERQGGDFKVVLQDAAGNTTTESFHVYIRDRYNLDFETGPNTSGIPTGWTTWQSNGSTLSCSGNVNEEDLNTYQGNYVGEITNPQSNHAKLQRQLAVKANTNYRVRGHIRTINVVDTQNSNINTQQGATIDVYCGGWIRGTRTQELLGTNEWTEVSLEFNSGNNTTVKVNCSLGGFGNVCTGTAFFDDIYLEEI